MSVSNRDTSNRHTITRYTRAPMKHKKVKAPYPHLELNPGPSAPQSTALPSELSSQACIKSDRIDPLHYCGRISCSLIRFCSPAQPNCVKKVYMKYDAAKNDENYHELYLEQMSFVSINLFVTARSSATFSKGKKDHSIISCRFCVMNVPLPSALRPPPPFVARGVRLRSVRDSRSILHLAGCKLCPPRSPSPVPPPLRSFSFFFGKFETKAKESGAIWHRMDSSPLSPSTPSPTYTEHA